MEIIWRSYGDHMEIIWRSYGDHMEIIDRLIYWSYPSSYPLYRHIIFRSRLSGDHGCEPLAALVALGFQQLRIVKGVAGGSDQLTGRHVQIFGHLTDLTRPEIESGECTHTQIYIYLWGIYNIHIHMYDRSQIDDDLWTIIITPEKKMLVGSVGSWNAHLSD